MLGVIKLTKGMTPKKLLDKGDYPDTNVDYKINDNLMREKSETGTTASDLKQDPNAYKV